MATNLLKVSIFCILSLTATIVCGQSQSGKGRKVLIRNVYLTDQENSSDIIVSILIKGTKLQLITKDKIPLKDVDIAFDANQGFIFGTLDIGGLAGFMIVDEDPREHIDVLLDTKAYTIFAVHQGEIVLNILKRIGEEYVEKQRYGGWRAYAPPPVALPLSYHSNRKWNMIKTKPLTIMLVGVVSLENTRWPSQSEANREQVGELSEYEGGSIRGFQAGAVGSFNFKKPWTYLLFVTTSSYERGFNEGAIQEFGLYEYRVNIPIGKVVMSLGKIKEPIGMERLFSLLYLPASQERASMSDGFLRSRNVGILFSGSAIKSRMSWAVGAFNPWFDEGTSFKNTSSVLAARFTGLPLISEDESNLLHLGVASRYSNGAGGIRYKTGTEIFRGPPSTDTELMDASGAFTFDLEIAWQKGPLLILGEYLKSNVMASSRNNPTYNGYHITASYILTGEMRTYNKLSGTFSSIPVAKSVNAGGWGEWDFYMRWSTIDLLDKFNDGGKLATLSTGLNWWPTINTQVNFTYRYSILDRFDLKGSNQGFVTRLVIMLD